MASDRLEQRHRECSRYPASRRQDRGAGSASSPQRPDLCAPTLAGRTLSRDNATGCAADNRVRNRLELRAERQVLQTAGMGDARISALARVLEAVGQKISDKMILRYTRRSVYSLEKVVALTKPDRPSAHGYPIPA